MEKREPSCTIGGNVNCWNHYGGLPKKLRIELSTKMKCTTWKLWVKFIQYLTEDCSPRDILSHSSKKLFREVRGEVSKYVIYLSLCIHGGLVPGPPTNTHMLESLIQNRIVQWIQPVLHYLWVLHLQIQPTVDGNFNWWLVESAGVQHKIREGQLYIYWKKICR